MLGNPSVEATIPVVNLQRAKKFYTDTLGLQLAGEPYGGVRLKAGRGTYLLLYPRAATKADHTVAGFIVKDLDAVMAELRKKRVKFEEYDFPGLKTIKGVATFGTMKAAWFKDTEGNILGLGQE